MSGRWPFTAEKIAARLQVIAPFVHRRRLDLPAFRLMPLAGPMIDAPICHDPTHWEEVPHESYWGHADLNFVMKSAFQVPDGWNPDHLALHLPLGVLGDIFNHPEALVHIDREPIGSADRYHHTIRLDPNLADGKDHVLSLHGWTGLTSWPPDPDCKAKLMMGRPALVERDPVVLSFYRLASTALDVAKQLDPDSAEAIGLLRTLDEALAALDTRHPIGDEMRFSAPAALQRLQNGIEHVGNALGVTLHGIGHAHMDIAYLWTIDQIRLKNARTYSNVLRLMNADPGYRFSHSQPQLYAMTQQDYPSLFEQIKNRVAEGRWEVMGGMWVEPDLNIPGGEALIRQITLGRTYYRETFGDVETPVLWLPDTFGFPAQIPQLMKLGGLKWFVTNKLNWNQRNAVPASTHLWEGLDGTRVLSHVLTTPRDVQYLPFPTNYKSDLTAAEVLGTWSRSSGPPGQRDLPICFGYGDGGGGPTEDLLAKAHAYANMPGMPRFEFSTVRTAMERIEDSAGELQVWRGEHYMEGHRGVFTSQGWIKRANRKAEWALHEAEALAAMANVRVDLDEAWQKLCLNQFHDIITGTSITAVFDDARDDFRWIGTNVEAAAREAVAALQGAELCVLNTSPVRGARAAIVDASIEGGQQVEGGVLVLFDDLAPYSIRAVAKWDWPDRPVEVATTDQGILLENAFVRVLLSPEGHVVEMEDKTLQRQVVAPGTRGNVLLAFEDRPICWDAWDIDPGYEDRQEEVIGDVSVSVIEEGPLRASVQIVRNWRSSCIRQTIRLTANSRRLDFDTEVDWHERHTLLKVAFPTPIDATYAEYDVQWGRVARSTTRDTPFDAARFEVPAQKWAQLSDTVQSIAVLNDCKYGYDTLGGTIRLTLLKCATSPDPEADQGHHRFIFSLLSYPTDQPALLDRSAYDLNAPLRIAPATERPPLIEPMDDGVVVETVKPANDCDGIVVRLFEARGRRRRVDLRCGRPVLGAERISIFEQFEADVPVEDKTVSLDIGAFEIVTLRLRFHEAAHDTAL